MKNGVKKIQTAGYNGARTVCILKTSDHLLIDSQSMLKKWILFWTNNVKNIFWDFLKCQLKWEKCEFTKYILKKGFLHGINFWTSLNLFVLFCIKLDIVCVIASYRRSKIALGWLSRAGWVLKTNGSWLWLFLVIYSRVAISYFAFFSGLVKMARDFLEDLPWDE